MKMQSLPVLAAGLCALTLPALAADWPQWRGPDRTDLSKETGLMRTWPKDGPPLLWTCGAAGVGYSGPAIVDERLFTAGARDKRESVFALDGRTGKELWSTPIGPLFSEGHGDGPRGTPTVDGELLYVLGAQGDLLCAETATGKKRWSVHLKKDLNGQLMSGWGYSESPLVDGEQVVVSPGGAKGTLAALNKRTGKVLWRSEGLTDPAAYSSMLVAEVGGIRHYIQMTGKGVAGVAADTGQRLWYHSKADVYRTAVIPTPLFHDHQVYVSAGYGAGCDLLRLTPEGEGIKKELVYANRNMVNHHGGVVLVGEHVYGYSDSRGWLCQDFKTGQIVWEEKAKLGKGSLTYADGHLYCYTEGNGTLVLIEATPQGWKEKGRFKIPQESTQRKPSGRTWTHPVVAGGRLYLRDQELIFCFDVKERTARAH